MSFDIKPCPFCKSVHVCLASKGEPNTKNYVTCVECETCYSAGPMAQKPILAINAWNSAERKV